MKRAVLFLGVVGAACAARSAEPVLPDMKYAALTLSNLPPLHAVMQAALDRVPNPIPELPDWSRRMRQSVWIPRLEVRYGMGEQRFRDYAIVDRREVTVGRETERETETQRQFSTDRDPLGTPTRSSSGSSRRDAHATRSSTSVRDLGPDSFSIGEHPRWLVAWEVALLWDFSLLLFRPEELDVARIRMDAARVQVDREQLLMNVRTQAITAYYELVEALRLLQLDTYRNSVPAWIRKERAAAVVDDMTGGLISRSLAAPPASR